MQRRAKPTSRVSPVTPLNVRIPDAGIMIGISERSVHRLIAKGELPTIRVGRTVLIPVKAIVRLYGEYDEVESA